MTFVKYATILVLNALEQEQTNVDHVNKDFIYMEIDAFHVQLKIVKNVNLKEIQAYVRSAINFIL